ncbi:type II secretion system F family protein [Micromonospora sp. NPDC049366]|uniref:type II secretion system F family protein n=1 Tax=Micromonospora sp. NPDC049366 TaxID=3364271 RepID=UPI0037AEF4A5
MAASAVTASCLVAAALLLVVARRRPARRLRALGRGAESRPARLRLHGTRPGRRLEREPADPPRPGWLGRPDVIRLAAMLAGIAVAVVVGGWVGLLAAAPTAPVLDHLLRRVEPPAVRDRRLREVADLPLAADLLAAAMRAGAPVDRSVLAVAEALDGPLADRLGRVGRTLRLGGGPEEAWSALNGVPAAERLTAAAYRSSNSGAALAGALTRLADDLRADRATAAEASARRAGVLIVLPLGLCFLPAFILAGLVPVIVAVLGDVL